MCRDIDTEALDGYLADFGCIAHKYCLNREPREFKFIMIKVDGAHWEGVKKLRRPDSTSQNGHLGCSERKGTFTY